MSVPGGLGRMPAADERDRLFSIAPLLQEVPDRHYRYWWAEGWWGDQGYTSQCVEFSWHHFMADGPVTHEQDAPLWPIGEVYHEAQTIDEWPGENYDGTSVRAGAKVLQRRGKISEYRWARNVDEIATTILTKSPVVVGTNWHEAMFYPNAKGVVVAAGPVVGGHAYLLNGVNTRTKMFRIKNSWGRSWGKNGHAYIRFSDMANLLAADGEACIAIEVATGE